MRARPSWIVSLSLLGMSAGMAWAQEAGGEYIPDCVYEHPGPSAGPGDDAAAILLVGGALLPLIAAWASMLGRNFPAARRWTVAAIVVAASQAAYGASRLAYPRSYEGLAPWVPDLGRFSMHLRSGNEAMMFFAAAVCGLFAAWATRVVAAAREAKRMRLTAGSRIRP